MADSRHKNNLCEFATREHKLKGDFMLKTRFETKNVEKNSGIHTRIDLV